MSDVSPRITHVLLSVVVDPGHNGLFSAYKIDSEDDGYTVTLRISKPPRELSSSPVPPPRPPSRWPRLFRASEDQHVGKPSHITEVLVKDRQQVEAFLRTLSSEFNVYQLTDLKPSYPFLHPTFYSFSFQDSAGNRHSFAYQIECANHLDEQYQRLVQEFNRFFESQRVFDAFFASQR